MRNLTNLDNGTSFDPILVEPKLRIIPNGATRNGDEITLKATLLLSPVPDATGTSTLTLRDWPGCVAELLALKEDKTFLNVTAQFTPTPTDDACAPPRPNAVKHPLRPVAPALFEAMRKERGSLNDIWRDSLVPDGLDKDAAWWHLAKTLKATQDGNRVAPGSGFSADTPPSEPIAPPQGAHGQILPTKVADQRECYAILGTGLAETAVALELGRARECLETLADKGALTKRIPDPAPDLISKVAKVELTSQDKAVIANANVSVEIKLALLGKTIELRVSEPNSSSLMSTEGRYFQAVDLFERKLLAEAQARSILPAERTIETLRKDLPDVLVAARKARFEAVRAAEGKARFDALSKEMQFDRKKSWDLFRGKEGGTEADVCCFDATTPERLVQDRRLHSDTLTKSLQRAEYGRWPSYLSDRDTARDVTAAAPDPGAESQAEAELRALVGQAYFGIESNPGLARIFGLAVDVEFSFPAPESDQRYGLITAYLKVPFQEATGRKIHTRVKLFSDSSRNIGRVWGWPVSSAEVRCWAKSPTKDADLPAECLSQYDGVIVMGGVPVNGITLPRFDVATLNVGAALEAERNWLDSVRASHEQSVTQNMEKDLLLVGPDYQSDGLTLLNRAAVGDAVRKLRRLATKQNPNGNCEETGISGDEEYVIHDAEDVTNGYRLLIGAPVSPGQANAPASEPSSFLMPTQWRSLMGRTVRYGGSGKGGQLVEDLLAIAVGPAGSPERIALESAMQAVPARDMPTGNVSGAADAVVETIVDETFGHWDGSPGGVACAEVKGPPTEIADSNCFGRRIDVPRQAGTDRPPNLRNGRPYRFALQAVFSGGRAVSVTDIPVETPEANGVTGRLYYPSRAIAKHGVTNTARVAPYFRALRHSRLGAPTILLPSGHATRENTPMGYDSSGKIIVRTIRGDAEARDQGRATPRIAQRLVLVPSLPQAAVARHLAQDTKQGVLDTRPVSGGAPTGALADLTYDLFRASGFPVAQTTTVRGIDGRRYLRSRQIVAGAGPDAIEPDMEEANAVYQPRNGTRATTYYPDPAADYLVLRLRRARAETGERPPLEGTPLAIPLTGSYPELRRVLLSLRTNTSDRRIDATPSQQAIMVNRGLRYINAARSGDIAGDVWMRDRAHEIAFQLFPGEHFALDLWLVPSAWRLAHDFALIQSMAASLACNRRSQSPRDLVDAVIGGLNDAGLYGAPWQEMVAALEDIARGADEGIRYVGPGGMIVPGTKILQLLGTAVHKAMLCHPVHEISAVRRVDLIHATNRHDVAPFAESLPPGSDPFPAAVVGPRAAATPIRVTTPRVEPMPLRAVRPATLGKPVAGVSDTMAIASGSKHFVLKGSVTVDLERIDTLEILARTVSPDSAVFDDPKRGRSLAHRLAGTWPKALGGDAEGILRQAQDIFGFKLAADGRVALQDAEIMLLRIDDIPPTQAGGAVTVIDLERYFLEPPASVTAPVDTHTQAEVSPKPLGRVSCRHLFPDGKARRLKVQINGLARTAEMMTTAPRELGQGDPWLNTDGIVHRVGELLDPQPLPRRLMEALSLSCEVILPATIRPAALLALSATHAIERERQILNGPSGALQIRVDQRARTRLRFGRGWFSSGVDERLGIVTWPPNQAAADEPRLAVNLVPLRSDPPSVGRFPSLNPEGCLAVPLGDPGIPEEEDRTAAIPNFDDADLGPGGRFVTRRGMDPTRIPNGKVHGGETQILLSKEAFPDLWRHPADPNLAEYVPHAWIPLGDAPETGGAGGAVMETPAEIAEALPPTTTAIDTVPQMACGLIAYMPRFDPVAEEWFVDVHLRPGRRADEIVRFGLLRYQPHTRPDLRCSRPVAVQAQPLPDRRVEIAHQDGTLTVTMEGPVSIGRLHEHGLRPDQIHIAERSSSILRVTAFVSGVAPNGTQTHEDISLDTLAISSANQDNLVTTRPDRSRIEVMPRGQVWTVRLPLGDIQQEPGTRLNLRIEEIEYWLPASYEGLIREPIDPLATHWLQQNIWRERNSGLDLTEEVTALIDGNSAALNGRISCIDP